MITNTIIVGQIQMDYLTFGRGEKPLILIQGLNTHRIKGAGFMLAWMYRIFTKDYKVYVFDRREDVKEGITVKDFAEDLALAMDNLKITKADIFAVSQGGMIAQYLALERPDLVNKMVLAMTLSRNNEMVTQVIHKWLNLTEQGDFKNLILDMTYKMYSESYVKRYQLFLPLLTILQKPKDIQRFMILTKACLTCNTYDQLENIQCPVLVIGGENDQIVGACASKEMAKKLMCTLYMYEEFGHAAYEEAKDFNQRVYDFLNS